MFHSEDFACQVMFDLYNRFKFDRVCFSTTVAERCPMDQNVRLIGNNDTGEDDSNNRSLPYDWPVTNRSSGESNEI